MRPLNWSSPAWAIYIALFANPATAAYVTELDIYSQLVRDRLVHIASWHLVGGWKWQHLAKYINFVLTEGQTPRVGSMCLQRRLLQNRLVDVGYTLR